MPSAERRKVALKRKNIAKKAKIGPLPPGLWRCPHCTNVFSTLKGGHHNHLRTCRARIQQQSAGTPPNLLADLCAPSPLSPEDDSNAPGTTVNDIRDNAMDILESTALEIRPSSISQKSSTLTRETHHRHRGAGDLGKRSSNNCETIEGHSETREVADNSGEDMDLRADEPGDSNPSEPVVPNLADGEIWIYHHPASSQPSGYISGRSGHRVDSTMTPTSSSATIHPFWPFATLQDYKQTAVFFKHNATDSYMNDQLELDRDRLQPSGNQITLKSAGDVHSTLKLAVPAATEFKVEEFETSYRGQTYVHRLRKRSLREIVKQILLEPDLIDHLVFYPEKVFVKDPLGSGIVWIWAESHHGDDWWDLQNTVGTGARILYIQLYVDATRVTLFGGTKVWPLYVWLGNIPSALRNKQGKGGAYLIAYLPVVHADKSLSPTDMAELRVKVYHQAMALVLESIQSMVKHGEYLQCGDGHVHFFVAVIAVISADYEELAKIASILGSQSGFPCPICLVPRSEQGNMRETWPCRTHSDTKSVLRRAREASTATFRKLIRREQSLRKTLSSFIPVLGDRFSLFQTFAADPLHQIEQGVFGSHLWPWLLEQVLNPKQQDQLDKRFKSIPTYPDLKHFPNGVTDLENVQGFEHGVILRMLAPLVADLVPKEKARRILRTIRALACIHVLSKLSTHSEHTLQLLSSQINTFGDLAAELNKIDETFSIAYPKMHSLSHYVDCIRRKGTTGNYHTGIGEALHPKTKLAFKNTNMQPGFEEQMLRRYLEQQAILNIQARVEQAGLIKNPKNQLQPDPQPTTRDLTNASSSESANTHIELGSPTPRVLTSDFIQNCQRRFPHHQHFERDLKTFLYQNVEGLATRRDFHLRDLPSIEGTSVIPYQLVRLSYVSLEDSQERLDVVRTNINWRNNGPRHDYVLVQGHESEGIWFANLLGLFVLDFRGLKLSIAHIRRFRTLQSRNQHTGYIELEDQGVYNFVYVDTLVRSCVILSPGIQHKRHVVADLVDADMYFRLSMFK